MTALLLSLAALVGCSTPPKGAEAPGCTAYASDPTMVAACVSAQAAEQGTTTEARRLCDTLPDAEAIACRSAWIQKHAAFTKQEQHLDFAAMCAGSDDCGFTLAEAWQLPDPLKQIEQCRRLAGHYLKDCMGHALERWSRTNPTAEDVERLAGAADAEPLIGYWIGVHAGCAHVPVDPAATDSALAVALHCPDGPARPECVRGFRDAVSQGTLCGSHSRPL